MGCAHRLSLMSNVRGPFIETEAPFLPRKTNALHALHKDQGAVPLELPEYQATPKGAAELRRSAS